MLREERKKLPPKTGVVSMENADVEVVPTGRNEDHFMKIHRKEHETQKTEGQKGKQD
jgi:hypothetical protein